MCIYIARNTEAVPEGRSLTDIQLAFRPVNLPSRMSGKQGEPTTLLRGMSAYSRERLLKFAFACIPGTQLSESSHSAETVRPAIRRLASPLLMARCSRPYRTSDDLRVY